MATITLQKVSKYFGQQQILNHVSLHVASHQITVITGQSGCGQSTLLNMIGLLEACEHGDI